MKYHVEEAGYDQSELGSLLHLLYEEVSGLYQLARLAQVCTA